MEQNLEDIEKFILPLHILTSGRCCHEVLHGTKQEGEVTSFMPESHAGPHGHDEDNPSPTSPMLDRKALSHLAFVRSVLTYPFMQIRKSGPRWQGAGIIICILSNYFTVDYCVQSIPLDFTLTCTDLHMDVSNVDILRSVFS